jgi:hypothetical protein
MMIIVPEPGEALNLTARTTEQDMVWRVVMVPGQNAEKAS